MKRIIAVILCLMFVLSAVGCNKVPAGRDEARVSSDTATDASSTTSSGNQSFGGSSIGNSSDTSSLVSSYNGVSSYDDFVDDFNKNNKINKTENEDGSVTIDIEDPTVEPDSDEDDTPTPAIPTIDKVTPTPSKPDTDDTSSNNTSSDDRSSSSESSSSDDRKEPVTPSTSSEATSSSEVKKPDPASQYTYTTGQKHRKLNYTERYLYSLLDDEKKEWYRAIDKAVTNLEARASFDCSMSEDRNYYIYYLYMSDNPECFYLGNSISIYNNGDGTWDLVLCYSDGENYCRYGHTPSEITPELRTSILKEKAIFDAEVERIISTIPSNAPDVVKEKLIYDRILKDCHYNLSARWNGICEPNWNAYGIIVNKYGVCESYSEAFQTLCFAVGINCAGVVGTAGGGHKWNVVELDGEWYMCDITFDDPIGGDPNDAYHYYFNLTSQKMAELNHDWSDNEWELPECTATKYSYQNYFGEY